VNKVEKYDVIVIGGGSAGFSAIMKAYELGASTLLINDNTIGLGGTCVNVGCVPTKNMLYMADMIHSVNKLKGKVFKEATLEDFSSMMETTKKIVKNLRKTKYEDLLGKLENVDFVQGEGKIEREGVISVNGEKYGYKNLIIATGSRNLIPPIKGLNETGFIDHVSFFSMTDLPTRIAIIGAGPQGIEFSQIFNRFGSEVYVFHNKERILPREDPDLALMLERYLQEEGIKIIKKANIKEVKKTRGGKAVKFTVNGYAGEIIVDEIFLAAGRKPNSDGLNLEKLGVKLGKRGEILVDKFMNASKKVFAAGDVTGYPMLETIAAREGMIAANNALHYVLKEMDYAGVPHAIFTTPQLSSVGLKEDEARKLGYKTDVRIVEMEYIPKAHAIFDTRGAVKIVIEKESKKILGLHILAPNSSEFIHEGLIAVKMGATIDDIINMVHVFPTLGESIKLASQAFYRDISKMPCCVE